SITFSESSSSRDPITCTPYDIASIACSIGSTGFGWPGRDGRGSPDDMHHLACRVSDHGAMPATSRQPWPQARLNSESGHLAHKPFMATMDQSYFGKVTLGALADLKAS